MNVKRYKSFVKLAAISAVTQSNLCQGHDLVINNLEIGITKGKPNTVDAPEDAELFTPIMHPDIVCRPTGDGRVCDSHVESNNVWNCYIVNHLECRQMTKK